MMKAGSFRPFYDQYLTALLLLQPSVVRRHGPGRMDIKELRFAGPLRDTRNVGNRHRTQPPRSAGHLKEAVAADPSLTPFLDQAVGRVLTTKARLGLLENPLRFGHAALEKTKLNPAAHRTIVGEATGKAMGSWRAWGQVGANAARKADNPCAQHLSRSPRRNPRKKAARPDCKPL